MNSGRLLTRVLSHRTNVNSVRRYNPEERIKELQKLFQQNDGVPVYLKRGFMDRVLYQSTLLLCGIGTVWVFYDLGKMAFKK